MPLPSPAPAPALGSLPRSGSPLAIPAFRRLIYAQACYGVAYSTFMILPKYLATAGVGPGRMSWVMASAALANVVGAPLIAWLGRRLGGPPAIMLGNALMALGAAGFALLPPGDTGPIVFVLRVLQGLSWALVFSSAAVMAMKLAPPGRLGEAIALHSSANLMTNALGPALAEPGLRVVGPVLVFLGAAAMALLAVWISAGLGAAIPRPRRQPRIRTRRGRPAGVLLATSVVLGAACGVMLTFHQPLALARGIGRVSDFLIAYTLAAVLVRLGLGRLTDRIGAARVAFAAFILYAAVVAAMPGLAPGGLAVFGAVFGLAHGLFWPAFLTLSLTPSGGPADTQEPDRERLLAFINAGFNAGVASVGLLGLVVERAGYALVFIPVGVLTACNALVLRRWTRRETPGTV